MILLTLLMFAVYVVASDDGLYYRLQSEAEILNSAGISAEDLRELDKRLADGLFAAWNSDTAFDNREIEVFGQMQPPFNSRELTHLYDCSRLLSIVRPGLTYALLLFTGGLFLLCCGRKLQRKHVIAAWLASALILLPIVILGIWAAVDFGSAFTFFHRMLFTNDLWLLDPNTDLLIRICPSSMFMNMGLRIALYSAGALLGIPLLVSLIYKSDKRKKERNEVADL